MTLHKDRNFCFRDPPCEDGDAFEKCNLTQAMPNTAICAGKTGLTFTKCNLVNCQLPGDAVIEGGLHIQKSFCAHLHPEWVEKGRLAAEPENCAHVVDTDEIRVGGALIETIYHYEDTVL